MLHMPKFCPFCGEEVDPDSIYCLNCGKKLPERAEPVKGVPSWEIPPTPAQPAYPRGPPVAVSYIPKPYHPSMSTKNVMVERCVALIIDDFINQICCIYGIFKDGIRDGQSIGKGIMNMRVIDFQTGEPATIGQSCIRNCLCGWLDGCCCYLYAFIDQDGRRIGDHIAGTVVILDQ